MGRAPAQGWRGLALWMLVAAVSTVPLACGPRPASIECRATNAGIVLEAAAGRVQVYPAGQPESMVAEGKLNEALALPPGRYDVRVVFASTRDRQTRWVRDIQLAAGAKAVHKVAFASGELNVGVATGAVPATAGEATVYVFRAGEHEEVVTTMGPGEAVLIEPGSYDVRVALMQGAEEKEARWRRDVPVEVGLQTKVKVAFRRGTLSVEVLNAGAPVPAAAALLTVFRAGDVQEERVDEGPAAVPLGLAAGRYDVRVRFVGTHDKPERWLRDLQIEDGETLEKQVEFSSGKAVIEAGTAAGALERFEAYVYYYRAGEHTQPVAYTPSGETVFLDEGLYDVRVHYFRAHDRPDAWLRNQAIDAGRTLARKVVFDSGKVLVRAYGANGTELVGDTVFLYIHAAGERGRPTVRARSGEVVILAAGTYDIRVEDTRRPDAEKWLDAIRIQGGTLVERTVVF